MEKNITFLLFSVKTVVLGINLHVSTVSASEDIPVDQTTLLDIENENSVRWYNNRECKKHT